VVVGAAALVGLATAVDAVAALVGVAAAVVAVDDAWELDEEHAVTAVRAPRATRTARRRTGG